MAKTHPRWLAVSAAMLLFGCSDDQESNIYPKPDSSLGPDAGRTSPDAAPTDAAPADAAPADAAPADAAPADARPHGPGHVRIEKQGDGFVLLRDGTPYYVRGVGGRSRLDVAARINANSIRTWGSEQAQGVLDGARANGLTVLLGIWLDHGAGSYTDQGYKNAKREELRGLLARHKNHPALLMWALGNEINLGADTREAWAFVNELAEMVHAQDPNHPTVTVLAGSAAGTIRNVVSYAPHVNVLGINSYGGIMNVDRDVRNSGFAGPYLITEWGPTGHWEVAKTSWGQPIEQTSAEKAAVYGERYDYIHANRSRALGSYVFLWGQKQERTPTWYGMFVEQMPELGLSGESCPTVDVLASKWTGSMPENQAPSVARLLVDGKRAAENVELRAGQSVVAEVSASDADSDSLTYSWEILKEPTQLGAGGSYEARPPRIGAAVKGGESSFRLVAPAAGQYRLLVYVLDGKGHAGTANVPFIVR